MNRFVLLGFLFISAIAFSSAGLIEIVLPENYTLGHPITQSDNITDGLGSLPNAVGESKREIRAFDTYVTLFCYNPQLTVFDFSKKKNIFLTWHKLLLNMNLNMLIFVIHRWWSS